MKKGFLLVLVGVALLATSNSYAQSCTNDAKVKKYKAKVDRGENVQSCSLCAELALYVCSARLTSSTNTGAKKELTRRIKLLKNNIKELNDPVCCTELVNKKIPWGKDL